MYFTYGDTEIDYLKKRCKALGAVIDEIGPYEREINPDLFSALVFSIIGQQISTTAHATIWKRILDGLGEVTPQSILACSEAELQSYGITFKKACYICGVAESVVDGRLDIDALRSKSDAEVCDELCQLSGVGKWTSEMIMLFSMQRPDIFSYGDLAIHRGLRMLYRHRKITPQLFEKYRRCYSPYGSVASLYLWAIAGGAVEGLKDCGAKYDKK